MKGFRDDDSFICSLLRRICNFQRRAHTAWKWLSEEVALGEYQKAAPG